MHRLLSRFVAGILLLSASVGVAHADEDGKEYSPIEHFIPHVSGDLQLTGTYRLWKDPANLDRRLVGDPQENWKLNWKFLDVPFNKDLHAGYLALERGEKLYKQLNRSGTFQNCLVMYRLGGRFENTLQGLRTNFPRYRLDLQKVAGLEEVIEHCAKLEGETLQNGSHDNSAVSIYIAAQSNGQPIDIDVSSGPMKEAYLRGEKLFHRKVGRNNLSCASCHVGRVGLSLRATIVTSPYGDAGHYPVYRDKYGLTSMHVRFTQCSIDLGFNPLRPGSQAYTDLEVFLTALTNGYPVSVPSERY